MTTPATAQKIGERLPSADEKASANQLRRILASQLIEGGDQILTVRDAKGGKADIALTPAISQLLIEVLRHIGKGDAVTLVPVSQMLTTQQAADILNVSRPHLVSLIEKSELPHSMVGRHRRIQAEDLFRYKAERDRTRDVALSSLAELDADLI
jgi:excisionase family DNA binding protein